MSNGSTSDIVNTRAILDEVNHELSNSLVTDQKTTAATSGTINKAINTRYLHSQKVDPGDMAKLPPLNLMPNLKFGPFAISPTQVFHLSKSRQTFGLVNLKPLLPGHTLVCPVRSVPRLSQLSISETTDLFLTVRRVSFTLRRLYHATSFNVAVQDGVDAGQSVPHVHVHVIPRVGGDMTDRPGGGDELYEMMDGVEGDLGATTVLSEWLKKRDRSRRDRKEFQGPDVDEHRKGRSEDEMSREADWLRVEMERDEEAYLAGSESSFSSSDSTSS